MDLFEKATKSQLRFETKAGLLGVEDLWRLPLTSTRGAVNLDDVARGLHKKLKEDSIESFVEEKPKADEVAQLAFDVVKRVIEVRKEEGKAAHESAQRAAAKANIAKLIQKKRDEKLGETSLEDLEKMYAEL
jgi:hypothetical protein